MTTPFLAVIPARLASTRLPRKPLADIDGVPMVVRVAERAARSGARRVVVATDAEETARVCNAHGIETLSTSAHHATGTDRLAEVVEQLKLNDDAIVVNVQGDEPLIPPDLIRDCAFLLARRADCAIATAAHPIHRGDEIGNPNIVKVVLDAHDRALYFSRASIPFDRDADGTTVRAAWRHIGLYAYRARFLRLFPRLEAPAVEILERLEQLRALYHGHAIAVLRCASAPPGGVDTLDDLERARTIVRHEREHLERSPRSPQHGSLIPKT